jgi:hypothetical protein
MWYNGSALARNPPVPAPRLLAQREGHSVSVTAYYLGSSIRGDSTVVK